MSKLSDWKIRTKLLLLIGVTVVVCVVALLGYQAWHELTTNRKELNRFETEEVAKVRQNLKNFVNIAYETIESSHRNSQDQLYLEAQYGYRLKNIIDVAESMIAVQIEGVKRGGLGLTAAQEQVKKAIASMRYDAGVGYIWINDTGKPYPRMVMHPTVPALDGQILDDPKYDTVGEDKKNLFQAFVEVCEANGEGFVRYLWPKPTAEGLSEDQPKLSYVRLIEEWDWIIGTGIYIDDAILAAKEESKKIIKQMRYDGGVGYFWINDTGKPYPRMVMHPTAPALDGQILDDPKYDTVGEEKKNLFQAFVEVCEANREGFVRYLWPKPTAEGLSEDQPKESYVRLFEPWNWIIGTGVYIDDIDTILNQKREDAQQRIVQSVGVSIGISVVLLIAALLILSLVLRAVTNPIAKMAEWSNLLAEGNLTKRIEFDGKNEIGTLSSNLNRAVESLRNLIDGIKAGSDQNVEAKQELVAGTTQTVALLTQIAANTNSIEEQISNLNNQIANSAASVEQISANITGLNNQIEDQSSAIEESTASVEEMLASIRNVAGITKTKKDSTEKLVETAKDGGQKLSTTGTLIEEITGSVDNILEMIAIINGIASKTNLLSMNAAIEAAHAGEFGKGFAVVADEIRQLAEATTENSKKISKVLAGVVEKINQAYTSSQATKKAFDEIDREVREVAMALSEISSTAEELSVGSDQILKAMTSLSEISVRVKEGSAEMNRGAAEVTQSQENTKNISAEVLDSIKEIVEGTEQITSAMNNVSTITEKLGAGAEHLESEVNKFETS